MKWLPVVGFDHYEVSDQGHVRNKKTQKILRSFPDANGYLIVTLSFSPKRGSKKVHRLVLEAFRGTAPAGFMAAHLNAKRDDPRLDNLQWVTPKENSFHRDHVHKSSRPPRGEAHARSKLGQ